GSSPNNGQKHDRNADHARNDNKRDFEHAFRPVTAPLAADTDQNSCAGGESESWAAMPAASQFCQASTKRPPLMRTMEIPVTLAGLPVALWTPETVQRRLTRSFSARTTPGSM